MGAAFAVVNPNAPTSAQMSQAIFQLGAASPGDPDNTSGLNTARTAYIDRTNFAARGAALYQNGNELETSIITDNSTGQSYSAATPYPNGTLSRTGLLMVNANTVGANSTSFLTSLSSTTVQPCQCEYTQWGFWSADTFRTDTAHNLGYSDRGNLMPWVAGISAKAADIPTVGTATYTGHAIANISNNGTQYVAAGAFSNQVNFATKSGIVQVAGLDGSTYGGVRLVQRNAALFRREPEHGAERSQHVDVRPVLPGRPEQHDAALWRDGRLFQHHRAGELYRQRHLRRSQALRRARPAQPATASSMAASRETPRAYGAAHGAATPIGGRFG